MSTQTTSTTLSCDGWCEPKNPVTHIGSKGYVYCQPCAVRRRNSGVGERTRKLRPAELKTLLSGQPLAKY